MDDDYDRGDEDQATVATTDVPLRPSADEHAVRVTGYPLNMAGWTWQKADRAMQGVRAIVDAVRLDTAISEESRTRILDGAYAAASNVTLLLHLGTGVPHVLEHGRQAIGTDDEYEHVRRTYRHGADYRAKAKRGRADELRWLADTTESYFAVGREGRTLLATLIRERADEALNALDELTEQASMGELSWAEYAAAVGDEVSVLRRMAQQLENDANNA